MSVISVTGASGFVGGALGRALAGRGTVRGLFRTKGPAAEAWTARGGEVVIGALEDEGALRRLVAGAEVVYHLAARSGKGDPDASRRVNVEGTARLARVSAEAEVSRLVYVSSISVFAATPPRHGLLDEQDMPVGVDHLNPYSRTKYEGEMRLRELQEAGEAPRFTIIRPTNIYGPGGRAWVLDWLRRVQRIPVVLGGDTRIDVVHVDDVAEGLVRAGAPDATSGRVLHLGHHEIELGAYVVRLAEAALQRRVRRLPGAIDFLVRQGIDRGHRLIHGSTRSLPLTRNVRFPHDEARRVIGYVPRTSLEEGLETLGAWYREPRPPLSSG